jgi:hypothetical protein
MFVTPLIEKGFYLPLSGSFLFTGCAESNATQSIIAEKKTPLRPQKAGFSQNSARTDIALPDAGESKD